MEDYIFQQFNTCACKNQFNSYFNVVNQVEKRNFEKNSFEVLANE